MNKINFEDLPENYKNFYGWDKVFLPTDSYVMDRGVLRFEQTIPEGKYSINDQADKYYKGEITLEELIQFCKNIGCSLSGFLDLNLVNEYIESFKININSWIEKELTYNKQEAKSKDSESDIDGFVFYMGKISVLEYLKSEIKSGKIKF